MASQPILTGNQWDTGGPIHRTSPFPTDITSICTSYSAATYYAVNDPTAYVGQIIGVVTANTAEQYQIVNTNGTLKSLGYQYPTMNTIDHAEGQGYLINGSGTNTNYFLRGDGTWTRVSGIDYPVLSSASHAANSNYIIKGPGTNTDLYLKGDGSWDTPPGASYSTFTSNSDGLVPMSGTNTTKYLQGNGTWSTPTNTTYNTFSTAANGLVPKPSVVSANTSNVLSGNGTWIPMSTESFIFYNYNGNQVTKTIYIAE